MANTRIDLDYTDRMKKWIDGAGVFLCVFGVLIYIGAKIHFFTHFGKMSEGEYLEQHWLFWAGLAVVFLLAWLLRRIQAYSECRAAKSEAKAQNHV